MRRVVRGSAFFVREEAKGRRTMENAERERRTTNGERQRRNRTTKSLDKRDDEANW